MKDRPLLRSVRGLLAFGVALGGVPASAQLIINQTQAPTTLVQNVLMGPGVFASNVTFNGNPGSMVASTGVGPSEIGRFNGSNTCLGLNSGIFLCTGVANSHLPGPNNQLGAPGGGIVVGGGVPSYSTPDLDLSHLTAWPYWQVSGGGNIHSKAVLEFDFVPIKDMVSFRYVFSSEEYETWVCSEYNDVFGFFISGPGIPDLAAPYSFTNNALNIAFIPGSVTPVSINSVNSGLMNASNAHGPDWTDPFRPCFNADPNWQANAQYYRYNGGQGGQQGPQLEAPYNTDPYYIQHNGMTVVLTASAAVQCGQTYHVKLAVGNVNDAAYPSAVFLEGGSFTSSDRFSMDVAPGPTVEFLPTDTVFIENDCDSVYLRFHRWGGFYLDEDITITTGGSATAGVDYLPALPTTVHFNQLDSTVIVPIAVPVDVDGIEDLVVNIITCNGQKVQTYVYTIDQRPPLQVVLDDQALTCPGTVTLTPQVTGGSNDPAALTYLWSTGETTPSISPLVLTTTQFWVTVKDSCWALPVTDSAWVTVPPYDPMVLTITPDTAILCLSTAQLQVSATQGAGGYTYQWSLNGAVQGTSATLTVPSADPAVYYVATVTDLCGMVAKDSVLVSQAPPPPLVLTTTPDTAIACLGHADLAVSVTGGGGVLSYSWANSTGVVGNTAVINVPAAVHETYTVTVSDQCGQSAQAQVVVTTGPTPPLVFTAEGDTAMCPNMNIVLNVLGVSGGGGAYSYAWSPGGTGPSNGPSLNVSVPDDAPFTVTVTDECGNQADTTVMAVVLDHDPLALTWSNDTIVCPGEPVPLWVTITGGAGSYVVQWPGIGSGPAVTWTAGHEGIMAGVNVTDLCGTTASGAVNVLVYPAGASIHATQLTEDQWQFTATTQPPTGVDIEWDLGDGTTATSTTVVYRYTDAQAHWVVLQVTTPEGCVALDSVRTRPPAGTIYFPNTFTPDGDGINETFGGEGRLIEEYELLIFDRWGRIAFESHDMADRWNGMIDGELAKSEVYSYRYRVSGVLMPMHMGFGHVTLLR
ncbi:MAG: choice-of-anchor L domain-containing protein [Bacteroidetes bacterium]|nr:choice-of-anchor L domain-containing protein [Bacteroidota bacterium]